MAGVNATYGPGTPLKIGQEHVWRGKDKTNGFLMRNVDGRIPALKQSFSRVDISALNVLSVAGAVPYGNGLWRDISRMDTDPGVVKTEKPERGVLVGIAEFNQGMQTGHPVQGWGVPQFMRADMINKGYVGYKVTMTAVGQEANYLAYLQGDKTHDVAGVRLTYEDWMALYAQAVDGARLALCFSNASGFPIMFIVDDPANVVASVPLNTTFGGFVDIFEPENEAVFVSFGYTIPTNAVLTPVAPIPPASSSEAGLMSALDKAKLDSIIEATTTTAGLLSAADKTKLDTVLANAAPNPAVATSTTDGLMSAADKAKLDGI